MQQSTIHNGTCLRANGT